MLVGERVVSLHDRPRHLKAENTTDRKSVQSVEGKRGARAELGPAESKVLESSLVSSGKAEGLRAESAMPVFRITSIPVSVEHDKGRTRCLCYPSRCSNHRTDTEDSGETGKLERSH